MMNAWRHKAVLPALFLLMLMACTGPISAETATIRALLDSAFVDLIRADYHHAIQKYRAVVAMDTTVAEAYRYLGWLQIVTTRKDLKAAEQNLRRAVALKPDEAGAYNDLGCVYVFGQNYPMSLDAFRSAVRLQPKVPLFVRNLGMAAAESRDDRTSEEMFRRAVALDSIDALAFYGLGLSLSRQERNDEAMDAYRVAVQIDPDLKEAYMGIGQIHARRREFQKAASAYERALQIDFYAPEPHYVLAGIYWQLGDSVRAEQEKRKFEVLEKQYRYVVRERYIFPVILDRVAACRLRGKVFARLGRYEQALAYYRAGLALADSSGSPYRFSPELPALRLAVGRAYQTLGEVTEARQSYEAVLAMDEFPPEAEEAQRQLADLYLYLDGIARTEVQGWERVVALDPTSAAALWIYERLCLAHQRAGRLDRCIDAYEAMRSLAPKSSGLRARLGVAYAVAGRVDAAAAEYRQAISIVEDPSALYRQLTALYRRAGRQVAADSIEAEMGAP